MPVPLIAVGLGLQAAGLAGQLFGRSEADKYEANRARRQRAVDAAVARMLALKRQAISEGTAKLGKQTAGMVASSRSAAMQRAAAAGRSAESEAYVLPAEAKMAQSGNEAMSNFVEGTNRMYDTATMNAQLAGLSEDVRPLPESPDWTDYATSIGGGLTTYGLLSQRPADTSSLTTEVPTTPLVSPQEMQGDLTPEPLPENPPEPGAFQIPQQASYRTEIPSYGFTQPETDYRSMQYNPRFRMARGLRRASIF